jgi:hypothetical protein
VGDDFYNKFHEEADIDPEDITRETDSMNLTNRGKAT